MAVHKKKLTEILITRSSQNVENMFVNRNSSKDVQYSLSLHNHLILLCVVSDWFSVPLTGV